ncbi:MAG: excalibur calcium-binding domain-containing protein [Propionicimonas sp.]
MRARLTVATLAIGLVGALGMSSQAASIPVATPVASSTATTPAVVEVTVLAAKVTVKKYKNCAALNKKYRHGVGKTTAKDKVSGRSKPVKNFKKHNALYRANKHLDRDRDGVACEKR